MFFPIRVSSDYRLIVIAEGPGPESPEPDDGVSYYHYNDSIHRTSPAGILSDTVDASTVFHELDYDEMVFYFSDMADDMGWGGLPEKGFDALEDVWTWFREQRKVWYITHLKEQIAFFEKSINDPNNDSDRKARQEDLLRRNREELANLEST